MRRFIPSSAATILACVVTASLSPRPGFAAVEPAPALDQLAHAWMGAVALLAHDGDREHGEHGRGEKCGCGKDGCDRCSREGRHGRGGHGHGERSHAEHGPGPRAAMEKIDEILGRLARIEAKLDGRAVGPGRGEWRGPRPEMPEHVRSMMEDRMREAREKMSDEDRRRMDERMKAARERMREGGDRPEGRPPIPEEVREQMRKRMEEGRERMEQARQALRQMEERIRKLEAEIERMKAER
jgi:hypothetical protein